MMTKIELPLEEGTIRKFNGLARAATGGNGSFLDLLEMGIEAATQNTATVP